MGITQFNITYIPGSGAKFVAKGAISAEAPFHLHSTVELPSS